MTSRQHVPLFVFVAAMIFVAAAATVWLSVRTERLDNSVNDLPRVFLRLERAIGYAGFIHNFKNYVLRPGESRYFDAALADYEEAVGALDELDAIIERIELDASLDELSAALTEYRAMLERARTLRSEGAAISEIDAAVRVSDLAASFDLAALQNRLEEIFDARRDDVRLWRRGAAAILTAFLLSASLGAVYLRRLRRSGRKLIRDVFDRAALAVAITDRHGRYRFFNDAYARLLPAWTNHVAIGRSETDALRAAMDEIDADEAAAADIRAALAAGPAPDGAIVDAPLKDGRIIEFLTYPMEDGERLSICRDVTAQRHEEQAHARELAHLVADLERSNKELDDFAYVASHDLKEPVRGIAINANFLARETVSEQGRERIDRMVALCRRMDQLIADLLFFSRLGHGDKDLVDVEPGRVIEAIRSQIGELLEERSGEIVVEAGLPVIRAERSKVKTVFQNLIVNGVHYNDSERRIVNIGFRSAVEANGRQLRDVFFVKDNGIGIEEKNHEKIFRIFTRLNPEKRFGPGTGAGLSFVHKIIEEAGCEITLVSQPGEGSVFYFSLPLARPNPRI